MCDNKKGKKICVVLCKFQLLFSVYKQWIPCACLKYEYEETYEKLSSSYSYFERTPYSRHVNLHVYIYTVGRGLFGIKLKGRFINIRSEPHVVNLPGYSRDL